MVLPYGWPEVISARETIKPGKQDFQNSVQIFFYNEDVLRWKKHETDFFYLSRFTEKGSQFKCRSGLFFNDGGCKEIVNLL